MSEEEKLGMFQGNPDKRSLNKVINLLVQAKKVKVIKTTITEPTLNKSKEIVFICLPTVDESMFSTKFGLNFYFELQYNF